MKIFVIYSGPWDGSTITGSGDGSGDGSTITLERINPSDSIWDVKTKISWWIPVHPHVQVLYFAGQVLGDDRTLAELNIMDESTLHLVFPNLW